MEIVVTRRRPGYRCAWWACVLGAGGVSTYAVAWNAPLWDVVSVLLAALGVLAFLASLVGALGSVQADRVPRSVRDWAVVVLARTWALVWGSLVVTYLAAGVAGGERVAGSDDRIDVASYGVPLRWVEQEDAYFTPGVADLSWSPNTVWHVDGDAFVASWYVTALSVLAALWLAWRLRLLLLPDVGAKHRVTRDRTT